MQYSKYFGGTNITLEKLKEVLPYYNVDGTKYKIEEWLAEVEIFDNLIPLESKVWIPYNAECFGILKSIDWWKFEFKNYTDEPEYQDWWFYEPYLEVYHPDTKEVYYVYEISFYKSIKHKLRTARARKARKEKRRFLTKEDIINFKKQEVINNSIIKRKNVCT